MHELPLKLKYTPQKGFTMQIAGVEVVDEVGRESHGGFHGGLFVACHGVGFPPENNGEKREKGEKAHCVMYPRQVNKALLTLAVYSIQITILKFTKKYGTHKSSIYSCFTQVTGNLG